MKGFTLAVLPGVVLAYDESSAFDFASSPKPAASPKGHHEGPTVGKACVSGHKNEMCSQASSGCIWWPASKQDWEALHAAYAGCNLQEHQCKTAPNCQYENNQCKGVTVTTNATGNNTTTISISGTSIPPETKQTPTPNTTDYLSCMMPMKYENGTATCMHQSIPDDCVSGCEKSVFKTDCAKNSALCGQKCATCEHGSSCAAAGKGKGKKLRQRNGF